MPDSRQLSLLDAFDTGHAGTRDVGIPRPPAPAQLPDLQRLGQQLEEEDRRLASGSRLHLPALPVKVSRRANRSTMGSLRHRSEPQPHWALCLASSLLDSDPESALLLGQVLLRRVRRLPVPVEMKRQLKAGQIRWLAKLPKVGGRAFADRVSDPALAKRLHQVAELAGLGLPASGLPRIAWHAFATSRVLGRYDEAARCILIHQAFEGNRTPGWALDALIFHEFLHALLGSEQQGSRRVHHHARFRQAEAAWPDHQRWCEWIRNEWPASHRRWQRRNRAA